MDLHLIPDAVASEGERRAVDAVLGPPRTAWEGAAERRPVEGHVGRGGHEDWEQRHLLLPALQALQRRIGSLTPGGLNYVCQRLSVPPAEAYGVASFYALLALEPRPAAVAHVCDDIACRLQGATAHCAELARLLGPAGGDALDGRATWLPSPCLGLCEQAPAALIQVAGEAPIEYTLAPATTEALVRALSGQASVPAPAAGSRSAPQTRVAGVAGLRLLRRVGRVDPDGIDAYRGAGGFEALRQALRIGPTAVIREVTDSKLLGRGGAAFPMGRKWDDVARAPARPHYVVANADESEPGTFSNRVLMEEDPFALVESMTIAGFATAADRGYIYIRGEFPLAIARVENAIDAARRRGFLGESVMGEPFSFELEVRRGSGAYICGEETALFNSIEGKRGEPRNKPPFPTQSGLFGQPTVINNVETLVNVLDIVIQGGPAYAATGTEQSTGTKLFCVSGSVVRPGLYEVPFGVTLRELIDLCGGVPAGREVAAVLLGGAAGSFVTPAELDVALTFEGARAIGASLGSGVAMVFDDAADLQDAVLRIAAFFRDESCGQCVPCRVGTQRQEELLHRLASGRPLESVAAELVLFDEIAQVMRDASICGLGPTAPNAAQSAIEKLGLFGGSRR